MEELFGPTLTVKENGVWDKIKACYSVLLKMLLSKNHDFRSLPRRTQLNTCHSLTALEFTSLHIGVLLVKCSPHRLRQLILFLNQVGKSSRLFLYHLIRTVTNLLNITERCHGLVSIMKTEIERMLCQRGLASKAFQLWFWWVQMAKFSKPKYALKIKI